MSILRPRSRALLVLPAGLVLFGSLVTPAAADSGPIPVDGVYLAGPDGSSVDELVSDAVERNGADAVVQVLNDLVAMTMSGEAVAFPGVDGTAAEQNATLSRIAEAVQAGAPIPLEIGSRTALEMTDPAIVESPFPPENQSEYTDSGQGLAAKPTLKSSGALQPPPSPQVSDPTANTPSDYLVWGGAIADDYAWEMTAGFNIYHCTPSCALVDRKELTHIIDPGQWGTRVQTGVLYSPDSGNIYSTVSWGSMYLEGVLIGRQEQEQYWDFKTWYIPHTNLHVDGYHIIVGIEQRADYRDQNTGEAEEQVGWYRTLTATCFSDPDGYCKWWV